MSTRNCECSHVGKVRSREREGNQGAHSGNRKKIGLFLEALALATLKQKNTVFIKKKKIVPVLK